MKVCTNGNNKQFQTQYCYHTVKAIFSLLVRGLKVLLDFSSSMGHMVQGMGNHPTLKKSSLPTTREDLSSSPVQGTFEKNLKSAEFLF